MELNHLRYFLSVVRERSFSRAARRMAVTPSTLYRRLRDLELDLGVTLLERRDGEIYLSATGNAFVGCAQRIVDKATFLKEDMAGLAKGAKGLVRIGTNGIAAELPEISAMLMRVSREFDDLVVRVVAMNSTEQLSAIRTGLLDIGLAYVPSEGDANLVFKPLQHQGFLLAVASDHRLADVRSLKLVDLADEDFVFQSRGSGGTIHDRLIAACSRAGLIPRIKHYILDEDTQLAMVAAGMGVSLTLEGAAARRWRRGVAFIPVEDLDVGINLDLVWNRDKVSPHASRVIEAIGRWDETG